MNIFILKDALALKFQLGKFFGDEEAKNDIKNMINPFGVIHKFVSFLPDGLY